MRQILSPTSTRRAAVAVAGLAVAAVGTVAGPAAAATDVFPDAAGDVAHDVDLWSVKVVNERLVRVVVQHDDLVRSFTSGASMTVFLDTDRSERGPEYAFVTGLFEGTDYALVKTDGWKLRDRAVDLGCSYGMRIDYADDITRVRVGRDCLDHPGQVRVAVKAGGEQRDGDIVRDWLDARRSLTSWVARG